MSGSTGFTSTSGWRTTACARWWSSARAPTGRRSSSRSRTGTAKVPRAGRSCCEGCSAAGSRRPWSRLAMGPWGFWSAVRDVWPQTAAQRDWFHKLGNVLDKLPKRLQPKAKRALHDILAAETREQAEEHLDTFVAEYEATYPKAAACLATDREALLTFFAFPAEHWIHLRTTNVIESPFATVRLRQRVTKGAGSRTKGLLMAYKLLDMAQRRWRRLNAAHLLPLVRAGVVFIDGVQQEPNTEEDRKEAA